MTAHAHSESERLFSGYLDPVDGTCCVPAHSTSEDIRALIAEHPLRFPLLLDQSAPLLAQVHASTHASASYRFGPFCDNILGMNWSLPNGKTVRVGERVAKSTTGYDWLRFLLHTGSRFGRPLDYVLRLRPDSGFDAMVQFNGPANALQHCVKALLHDGWMHWWDSVDYITKENHAFVRIHFNTLEQESPLFVAHLKTIASKCGLEISVQAPASLPPDGLPDIVFKTTPDQTIGLAHSLAARGLCATALCYSGVVHAFLPDLNHVEETVKQIAQPHEENIFAAGGDWHSRHLTHIPALDAETEWLNCLKPALESQ